MTQAQKTAKEKFKKAIEYRNKTGCSLKEAFAHAYGRKVGAVKKAPVKKSSPGKHIDTKSHNVNIKIVSGINTEYNIEGKKVKVKAEKTNTGTIYYSVMIDGAEIETIFPDYKSTDILNDIAPNISRFIINTSGYKSSKQIGEIKRKVIKLCNSLLKQVVKMNEKNKKAIVKKVAVKKAPAKKVARQSRSSKKVKATYKVDYQTGSENRTDRGKNQDAKRKALPPGKRISESGRTYYETRENRTDFSRSAMTGVNNYRYDKQREIIIGKIGNIKPLESLVPQVKIRLTRGKKVYTNKITTISSCVDILRKFIGKAQIETQEFFAVMYLNNNNNVLGVYIVGMGGYTSVVADTRLILSAGLRIGATGLILCHNHPSGSLIPSDADKQVTKKIEAGAKFHDMKVIDHIILTKDGYFSFASDNLI